MQRITRITDQRGTQDYEADRYPLSIGARQSAIPIPGCEEDIAHIDLQQGHPKLFNPNATANLWHNHQLVQQPVWLKSGDWIEYRHYRINWLVIGDRIQVDICPNIKQTVTNTTETNSVTYQTPPKHEQIISKEPEKRSRIPLPWLLSGLLLLLSFSLFILLARPISIVITPEPELIHFEGSWPILNLSMSRLALPGNYQLMASRQGYQVLTEHFTVNSDSKLNLQYQLQKLPGLLDIRSDPVSAAISIDTQPLGNSPLNSLKVAAGNHQIKLSAPRFQELETNINVIGMEQLQTFSFSLSPNWAAISITSIPSGAEIKQDDQVIGSTPKTLELTAGSQQLTLTKTGYKKQTLKFDVIATQTQTLEPIKLIKKPKPKAKQRVVPKTQYGTVFITTQPADATLWVDGKKQANATMRLRLSAKKHQLKAVKKGYSDYETSVTANSNKTQTINIILKSGVVPNQDQAYINSPDGQRLVRVKASPVFMMGASRREPGRRSNENQRKIQLSRAFYISKMEVSNAQFRAYRPNHNSGEFNRFTLNDDPLPVVNVSWQDAAGYANWLSSQEGLPPAYQLNNGHWQLSKPVNTGYRLPTEAEWEYVARYARRQTASRFAWPGGRFPPTVLSGNYADTSARDYLPQIINDYSDGYVISAPVKSFNANVVGIYNLSGNVSEWIHDFYAIYPGVSQTLEKDPIGPEQGRHHVIKGASWKDASITELRFSYRDYSDKARNDLGFRIARYVQ